MSTIIKFHKDDKIRKFTIVGSGRYASYKDAIDVGTNKILRFAATKGYVVSDNDAPRGGKYGEHFKVLKCFTIDSMRAKMHAEERRLNKALEAVVEAKKVFEFETSSDIGSFVIDGESYSNFYGDGTNIAEVCEVDYDAFKAAKFLSRREVFNPNSPLTVKRFEAPKGIVVSNYDVDDSLGTTKLDNVLGFVIWERKIKIFIDGK